ncbi:ABC transporter permease [Candidatus Woesearchaeota archaeon]|nr:ABC transporter permease [Candidatus Woesearchaeota archaeon]
MDADIAILAARNVAKGKKRAFLTILGIFIGIVAVVALVSLGQGLQRTINEQFEKVGADKILIQAKQVGFGDADAPGQLTKRDIDIISNAHGVNQVAGFLFRAGSVEFNNVQRTLYVMSVPEKPAEIDLSNAFHTMDADEGRLLTHNDRQKAVIGTSVAHNRQFRKNAGIGNKILVNGESFEIVGILKRIGDPGMDGSVVIAEEDARRLLNASLEYTMVVAQAGQPEIVAERIEKVLRRDRNQKEGKEDFSVQSSTDLIETFNKVLLIIQVVFAGIAAISLLVAGTGIMNTMYTAVLERTQEIGVMKAIGAKNSHILVLFLIESGLLGLTGGILGVVTGFAISKGVEVAANSAFGAGTITAIYPPYLIIGALAFSAIIGMISGTLPALQAAKLKPVEALRYE